MQACYRTYWEAYCGKGPINFCISHFYPYYILTFQYTSQNSNLGFYSTTFTRKVGTELNTIQKTNSAKNFMNINRKRDKCNVFDFVS